MTDVSLPRSSANNGAATPATTGSITAVVGDLLICCITVIGTNPTIATPTGGGTWQVLQNQSGSVVTMGTFFLPNSAGGATNPSAVLGGTVTGWVATIYEFTQTGSNCTNQGNAGRSLTQAAVTDIFNGQIGQTIPQLLFIMTIGRASTNAFTPAFTGLGPSNTSGWSASVLPQNAQGCQQDFYWGTNLAQGVGAWPTAPGTLGSSAVWKVAGAWFNTLGSNPSFGDNVSGSSGIYVPAQYQGMIGG